MINGLGLFASLGTPDAAQPQPAPAEDPAVFAAALVAALGLQQPVQVTVAPVKPVVEGEELTDDEQEPQVEGEETAVALKAQPVEGEDALDAELEIERKAETVAVPVARVTPDPEAEEEAATLGRLVSPKKGERVDVTINEPAKPVAAGKPTTEKVKSSSEPVTPQPHVSQAVGPKAKAQASATQESLAAEPMVVETTETPRKTEKKERKAIEANAPVAQPSPEAQVAAPAPDAPAPVVAGPMILPPPPPPMDAAPETVTRDEPLPAHRTTESAAPVDAPRVTPPVIKPTTQRPSPAVTAAPAAEDQPMEHAPVEPKQAKAPPQSVEERTARAMAENVRVGRQLAELLGDEQITALKVQLGNRRPANDASKAIIPETESITENDAPVVWQRVVPIKSGDTFTGPISPTDTPLAKMERQPVDGTFAKEALEPIVARPFARDAVTITSVTSRPEIVRMVANASLATSPNLAKTEGTPAVGKTPAPSVMPSLPDVRQELPVMAAKPRAASEGDREHASARDSHSSADASASSIATANNQTANKQSAAPEQSRETREARNLPPHDSSEQKAAGSADRVSLQVADEDGRQTRIRVSVTGNQIRAVITPPDAMSARQLEQRMDQLHETLVRQGFSDPKVVVRAAPEQGSDAALAANGSGSSQDVRSAVPAGKDQPAGDQRQGRGQREQDRGDGHRHPQGHSRERDPRDRRR